MAAEGTGSGREAGKNQDAGNENERRKGEEPGFKVVDRRRAGRDEPAAESAATPPAGPPSEPQPERAAAVRPPPIDFTTFVLSFASTALIQMGAAPDPDTGQTSSHPELARETIDLLGMLREKTRGNLTDEETRFFDALLYDLRVKYVELTTRRG